LEKLKHNGKKPPLELLNELKIMKNYFYKLKEVVFEFLEKKFPLNFRKCSGSGSTGSTCMNPDPDPSISKQKW
jgi:hypothetical protein